MNKLFARCHATCMTNASTPQHKKERIWSWAQKLPEGVWRPMFRLTRSHALLHAACHGCGRSSWRRWTQRPAGSPPGRGGPSHSARRRPPAPLQYPHRFRQAFLAVPFHDAMANNVRRGWVVGRGVCECRRPIPSPSAPPRKTSSAQAVAVPLCKHCPANPSVLAPFAPFTREPVGLVP